MFLLGTDKNSSGQFSWPTLPNYCHLTPLAEVPSGSEEGEARSGHSSAKSTVVWGLTPYQLSSCLQQCQGQALPGTQLQPIEYITAHFTSAHLRSSLMQPTRQNTCWGKIVQTLELLPRDITNFVFPTWRTQDFRNMPYLSLIRGPLSPPVRRSFFFSPSLMQVSLEQCYT